MKIISFLNQKGGVGKTTLATNIATKLYRDGEKVLLVDADPQGSATDWHAASVLNNKGSKEITFIGLGKPTLDKAIKKVADDFDWIIIDGPPSIKDITIAAIRCSNLIIIPVTPSPYDVWATVELVGWIEEWQKLTKSKLQTYFCISRKIVNTVISNEVIEALKEFDFPRLVNSTTQRVAYIDSVKDGHSVFDTGNEKAIKEIMDITNEIKEITK